MAAFDHGFKIIAQTSGQALARLAGLDCRHWQPLESTIQTTTERLADRVFLSKSGRQSYLVYMECLTYWDRSAPWSLLSKSAMLAARERLPVMSLVYILHPKGFHRQDGTLRLEINGMPTQQVWFHELCLWEIEPEDWWEYEPGLLAISPLCKKHGEPRQLISHATERIEATEADSLRRADLLTTLAVFGKLAFPTLDIRSLIGREKMDESLFYKEVFEEGAEEGAFRTRRADVVRILTKRFGKKATSGLQKSLEAIRDPKRLDHLLDLAIDCGEAAEFRAELVK